MSEIRPLLTLPALGVSGTRAGVDMASSKASHDIGVRAAQPPTITNNDTKHFISALLKDNWLLAFIIPLAIILENIIQTTKDF